MKILTLITLFIISPTVLFSQVSLKTGVSKSTIHIGDYLTYYIRITYDKNIKLILPPPGKELGSFDIKDYNIIEEETKDKKSNIKIIQYKITTYILGDFEIPSIEIEYEDEKKNKGTLKTEPLLIKVVPIKRLPSDIDDIRDIKKQQIIPTYLWFYILILLVVIGTGIGVYYYFRKRLKEGDQGTITPQKIVKVPEHIEALNKIKELQEKDYLKNKQFKLFYFELSEIIREYLHKRFHIYTLERTSFEIMVDLRKTLSDKKLLNSFETFFAHTDIVKFAKYKPTHNEIKGAIEKSINLINITKKEEPTDEAA